jgi:phosphate transport system protein
MLDHTTRGFDGDLSELTRKIEEMGRLDEKQIEDAIDALENRDSALAKRIIAIDAQIDALQRDIEEKAVATIARRQPVAVDLREIAGALRIANDLERIGDLAKNVAKRTLVLNDALPPSAVMLQLRRLLELVRGQLGEVLLSYGKHDVASALEIWRKDREIDALHNSLFRELLTYMMENPQNITFSTHVLFCSKNVERMGDHVTNIAETIYYIVQGTPLSEERPKADMTSESALPGA